MLVPAGLWYEVCDNEVAMRQTSSSTLKRIVQLGVIGWIGLTAAALAYATTMYRQRFLESEFRSWAERQQGALETPGALPLIGGQTSNESAKP